MGLMMDAITKASDWIGGWFRTWSSVEFDDFFETEDVDWVGGPLDGLRALWIRPKYCISRLSWKFPFHQFA